MSSGKQWPFRGVQLDLARQMETVEYIEEFMDFMPQWGLNTLVLYLEGRIRTASFPYPAAEESYTPEEMKRVVAHAAERGIEVIPVASCLGHAEQFLRYAELEHLGELRGGRLGRFGSHQHCFCPSQPELYEFLGKYLGELAEIFPAPYMHLGCDEAWDFGYCDLCRPRAEGEGGPSRIFAQHLRDLHAIVTGKLGKRIIIWDDMFEQYEEAMEEIPRDIVMCCWQYDYVDKPRAHFKNIQRWDALGDYQRLGFDSIVGSRELVADNILTLTKYAAGQEPLGAFVTTWEHSSDFLHAYYPNLAFAGRLWADLAGLDQAEALKQETVAEMFPEADGPTRAALRAFMDTSGMAQSFSVDPFLRRFSPSRMAERRLTNGWLLHTLQAYGEQATGVAADVVEDMVTLLRSYAVQFDLREIVPEVFEKAQAEDAGLEACAARDELGARLDAVVTEIDSVAAVRRAQWNKHRPGVLSTHDALNRTWTAFRQNIADFAAAVKSGTLEQTGLLTLELFLPDAYSAAQLSVAVRYAGSEEWTPVAQGSYKPMFFGMDTEYDHSAYYRVPLRMDAHQAVEACRLEVWSYGGQGIRYLEINNRAGRYVPGSLSEVYGRVEHPQALLVDNSTWCYLGDPDTHTAVLHPEIARVRHGMTVRMRRDG